MVNNSDGEQPNLKQSRKFFKKDFKVVTVKFHQQWLQMTSKQYTKGILKKKKGKTKVIKWIL